MSMHYYKSMIKKKEEKQDIKEQSDFINVR